MILIGVWLLSTNTMGIKTTDFILLVAKRNADVISRERKDLVDSYTQEEIKVEFILDCLFAKSKNQRSTEAHNIMAMSDLEFISQISG